MVTQGTSATNRQFEEAIARGDAAACAAVYSEDAKILPPDSPALTGKQAAQSLWQSIIDTGVKGVTLQTLELEAPTRWEILIDVSRPDDPTLAIETPEVG